MNSSSRGAINSSTVVNKVGLHSPSKMKTIHPRTLQVDPAVAVLAQSKVSVELTGNPIVDRVRQKIGDRVGQGGFRGLVRTLRILDENGSKSLDYQEFKSGLEIYGVFLPTEDLDVIFSYFDRDRSGSVDITEFVRIMRGNMNNFRRDLVIRVYDLLDQNTDGTVRLDDLKKCYDASRHPQVLSGQCTAQQILMEFMKGWDKNGDVIVTREEFVEYYQDLSACIDDDKYFELMIRNAWHLYGGEGAAANTTNLRVLVIHTDGTQTIETLQNDLGIKKTDTQRIIQRLKQQGINDVKTVSVVGKV